MRSILLIAILLSFCTNTFSQKNSTNQILTEAQKQEQSDPKATAILDKLKIKYEAFSSIQASFSLIIEMGEEKEIQTGNLFQSGDKYKLQMKNQDIISDGKTVWLHLKKNNEVQINNIDPDDSQASLSPTGMLKVYEKKEVIYALVGESREGGVLYQSIEFKPISDDEEYSKIRLKVDKENMAIKQVNVFTKNGIRYTLKIEELIPNKKIKDANFSFDSTQFPNINIEDLRLD